MLKVLNGKLLLIINLKGVFQQGIYKIRKNCLDFSIKNRLDYDDDDSLI